MSFSQRRPYAGSDDQTITHALGLGDADAFAEIYERYWYAVFEQAWRRTGSREVAEELVQDVFEELWKRRGLSNILQLRPYLLSAARYRVVDYYKSRRVQEAYVSYQQCHAVATVGTDDPMAAEDLAKALSNSLQLLPEKTREVFRLRRFEQLSVAEIAAQMQLSTKAVEYHLTRSCYLLRLSLRDYLVSVPLLVALLNG